MKKEEVNIYREIQKNTEMAISAIDTVSSKIYDDSLAMQAARESIKYSDIRSRALDKLLQGKAEPYKSGQLSEFTLKQGIHMNTLLNTSTSHVAELMIQGSNKGIVDMCKVLNKYPGANNKATELARELIDFEEKNIARLKKYL